MRKGPEDPLTVVLGAQKAGGFAAWLQQPGGRALLMLDALDEVEPASRDRVTMSAGAFLAKFHVVPLLALARPPVGERDYGMANLDAHLTMQPLPCGEADAFVAQKFSDHEKRSLFMRFAHRGGLDQLAVAAGNCTYQCLSTYQDVLTLADFWQQAAKPVPMSLLWHGRSGVWRLGRRTGAV